MVATNIDLPVMVGPSRGHGAALGSLGLCLPLLYWLSRENYLLFHGMIEILSVAVVWGVFLLVWNARRFLAHDAFVCLGIGLFFTGWLDLLHTLAYKGMGVLAAVHDANPATQLWIAARSLMTVSFLVFPFLLGRRMRMTAVMAGYAVVTVLLAGSILYWRIFPDCFIEGVGLTRFKRFAEYGICFLLAAAAVLFWRRRARLDPSFFRTLMTVLVVFIGAELCFTLYADVYGIMNFAGHCLKLLAMYLVYHALIHSAIRNPFSILFRELDSERETLRRSQADLRESRALYREIFEASRAPKLLIDPATGTIVDANPAAQAFYGYDRAVMKTMRIWDINMLGESGTRERMAKAANGEHTFFTFQHRLASGEIRDVEVFSGAVRVGGRNLLSSIIMDVTEHRRMEDALRLQVERYDLVIRGAHGSIWDWDVVRHKVFFSVQWKALRGYCEDEVGDEEENWINGIHPDDKPRVLAKLEEHFAGRTDVFEDEYRIRCKDGSWKWIMDRGIAHKDRQGTVLRMAGSETDITAKRAADEQLSESRQRFENAFEYAAVGTALVAPDGKWLKVNRSLCRFLGYSESELMGGCFQDITVQEDLATDLDNVRRVLAGEIATYQMEKRYRHKSGRVVWALLCVSLVRNSGGKPMYFLSQVQDITARKDAERQRAMTLVILDILNSVENLSEAANRLLEVIQCETGVEALGIRITEDGDYRYIAHRGFPSDFVAAEDHLCARGGDGAVLVDPDGKPRLECTCGLVLEGRACKMGSLSSPGGSVWTNDAAVTADALAGMDPRVHPRNLCVKKGYRSIALVPIRSGNDIVGILQLNDRRTGRFAPDMIGFLEGVASSMGIALTRRQSEEKLRNSLRHQMSLQSQLAEAQKMESIGRLAGGVAHDFNNNMFVVLGYAEMLLEQLDAADPSRQYVEQIRRASQQAADLTKQLLAFSRKQIIQPQPVDLDASVVQQQKILCRVLGEDIRVVTRLNSSPVPAMVDLGQFQQVLMNLCVNARDAMPGGGELILESSVVSAPPLRDGGKLVSGAAFVRITVVDHGVGMPPAIVERIFEPFFTTKEAGKGTGLGLSVVFGIVKQHGGWIDVDSHPGKGTRFDVHFPVATSEGGGVLETGSPVPAGNGELVLLVEDSAPVREIAMTRLDRLGYQVIVADGLESGWRAFQEAGGSIKILLSDVVLPDGNGVTLAERIAGADAAVGIILTSGYADERSRIAEIQNRRWAFLSKPYTRRQVASAIRSCLDRPIS